MNYNIDELFRFDEFNGTYAIEKYLKTADPSVTEIGIPAEYNGKQVATIGLYAFYISKYVKRVVVPPSIRRIAYGGFQDCRALERVELSEGLWIIDGGVFAKTSLKSIVLPKSLREIRSGAFMFCPELERVEFNSAPEIGLHAFGNCPKLPPETVAMGLVCSADLTRPVFKDTPEKKPLRSDLFRPDVFELLAKNNCFRGHDLKSLFCEIIGENKPELLSLAERYGMLEDEGLLDTLTEYSAERGKTEITAYLLEHKRRKFGFKGGDDFEL